MSKSEEILRPSDFINDPENCLFDEFKHNLPLNTEEVTDPKQLLCSRMRYLRTFRDMTQEEAADAAPRSAGKNRRGLERAGADAAAF